MPLENVDDLKPRKQVQYDLTQVNCESSVKLNALAAKLQCATYKH
jgi:hypothetical protein